MYVAYVSTLLFKDNRLPTTNWPTYFTCTFDQFFSDRRSSLKHNPEDAKWTFLPAERTGNRHAFSLGPQTQSFGCAVDFGPWNMYGYYKRLLYRAYVWVTGHIHQVARFRTDLDFRPCPLACEEVIQTRM